MRLAPYLLVGLMVAACEMTAAMDAGVPDAGRSDAGTSTDSGVQDGGTSRTDAGTRDGGSAHFDGGLCSPCVMSSDCGPGAFCTGGLTPRCGLDCTATNMCPGTLSCDFIHSGMGPVLGHNCTAEDTFCGARPDPGLNCTDTWTSYGQNFFATTCIGSCHRHDQAYTTVTDVRPAADGIRLAVESGNMPVGQTLTEPERRRLLTWLACGAP